MNKITLDPVLRSRLNGLNEELEVCNESGETVGHYVPAQVYRKLIYQLAEAQCPHTPEQLKVIQQQTGGRTLAEIWKDLGVS